MSTKTTFKRIALVAVAALGFGTLSVAPSNAGIGALWSISMASAPATATVGVSVKAIVKTSFVADAANDLSTVGCQFFAVPDTSSNTNSGLTIADGIDATYVATNATTNSTAPYAADSWNGYLKSSQIKATAGGRATGFTAVSFTADKAGTYQVRCFVQAVDTARAIYADWTVTAANPVVQKSTAFLNADTSSATVDASSFVYAAAASVTAKGALVVKQYSTTDTATVATDAISKDVVVAITKGLVSKTNDYFAGAKSVTTAAATAATNNYYVFANGEVGSASLTVTVGGTLVATKAITFSGVATTLSAALKTGEKTWIDAASGTTKLTVTAKDSAGNASSNTPTITATSATTTVATASVSGLEVTITGVAAGTSVITIADAATTSPASSTTYTVTVAPAASVTLPTLTFDKAEYLPGELMTITVAAAAADNASFAAFTAAPTVSVNVVNTVNPFTGGAVALVAGKATWKAYAPISAGPVVVTATSGAGSAATAAAVTATATVISDGLAQAAVDAAEEAIAAAEAATEAALTAAEAADAATTAAQDASDAVAALATQVTEWMDAIKAQNAALKAQITSLTNLIIKIQKKVKA